MMGCHLHRRRPATIITAGLTAALTLGLVAASSAYAQDATATPGTITLDRMDGSTRVSAQVGFDKIDRVKLSDGFAMRYELFADFVLPNRLVGLFSQVAVAHLFDFSSRPNSSDYTALSNWEIGAYFMPFHTSDLILRASIALPTASESFGRVETNYLVLFEGLTDFVLAVPNYTTLRLSASTVRQNQIGFFRADLGFDAVVDRPSTPGDQPRVFFRANVAGGIHLGTVDLTAELVNLAAVDGTVRGGITERFVHTAAVGFSTLGPDQFRAGTVFPLDESTRGDVWIFAVGYQHLMMN